MTNTGLLPLLFGLAALASTCSKERLPQSPALQPMAAAAAATTTDGTRPTLAAQQAVAIEGSTSSSRQPSLAPLVDHVRLSVVGVTTHTQVEVPREMQELMRRFFGQNIGPEEATGIGSGVIIDARGIVLTNNHVVEGADEVRVRTADSKDYRAVVKGSDRDTDLAVLHLRDVTSPLAAARLGNSDSLRVGDYVVAIGNPFGLSLTVTSGIISAKSRVIGIGPYDEFLQTDAAINPGNSGGPLFNLDGAVVGINTAISASGQNIGFAIPIDLAKSIASQLEGKGRVIRGFLGVAIQDLTPELSRAFGLSLDKGAVVGSVEPNSPAAKSGMKEGDVIFEMNGEPVDSAAQLSRRVSLLNPGQKVSIHFYRDRVARSTTATLVEHPAPGKGGAGSEKLPQKKEQSLGLTLSSIPPAVQTEAGVKQGALVTNVESGSRAERAGLRQGDIIVEANRQPIAKPDDFTTIVGATSKEQLLIRVVRRDGTRYIAIPPEGD